MPLPGHLPEFCLGTKGAVIYYTLVRAKGDATPYAQLMSAIIALYLM